MKDSTTNGSEAPAPGDLLDQAIAAINEAPVPAGPPPELVNRTLAALHEAEHLSLPSSPFISRNLLMKSLSAAAGLLLVAGAAFLVTTASPAPSMAFTKAVEQFRTARTLSYTKLIFVEGMEKPIKVREFFAEDGRHRSEQSGTTTISNSMMTRHLTLLEPTKTALVSAAGEGDANRPPRRFAEWLEGLKKLGSKPDRELGEKTVDGRRAAGFVATQGRLTYTIWVDVNSDEIVRIEYASPIEGSVQNIVMTDFQFNQPLDDSLFSLDVPEGYKVIEMNPVLDVPGGEESVIEALRGYTRLADGRFPSSIADWGAWSATLSKENDNGRPTAEATRISAHLGAITPFLFEMDKADYEYLGDGKTLADTEAIIFWYKAADGTFRAVYGDFTVKAVAADDLPR